MVCRQRTMIMMMIIRILLVFLVFSVSNGGLYKVDGRELLLSSEEDLELETQLKVLNKPPLQSFQKDDGSIIDCIDIYKQAAFDHPLLKNHKLQMKPRSSILEKMGISSSVDQQEDEGRMHDDSESRFPGCPSGTVPIRRTTKEDLIRAKKALSHYRTMIRGPPFTTELGDHFAGASTLEGTGNRYHGARVSLSLHNLTMMIPSQTSTASLRVASGVDGPFSAIEYGWTFNNELYGDRKSRNFAMWTGDGLQTGCFNMLCPGFVQVSKTRHLGDENTEFSVYGTADQKYMIYAIVKDEKTGNWWLVEKEYVGYWPKELFPNMKEYASQVEMGGRVYTPSLEPQQTPMGSGHFVPGDYSKTCHANIRVLDSSDKFIPNIAMKNVANSPDFYRSLYLDSSGDVLFGGPDFLG